MHGQATTGEAWAPLSYGITEHLARPEMQRGLTLPVWLTLWLDCCRTARFAKRDERGVWRGTAATLAERLSADPQRIRRAFAGLETMGMLAVVRKPKNQHEPYVLRLARFKYHPSQFNCNAADQPGSVPDRQNGLPHGQRKPPDHQTGLPVHQKLKRRSGKSAKVAKEGMKSISQILKENQEENTYGGGSTVRPGETPDLSPPQGKPEDDSSSDALLSPERAEWLRRRDQRRAQLQAENRRKLYGEDVDETGEVVQRLAGYLFNPHFADDLAANEQEAKLRWLVPVRSFTAAQRELFDRVVDEADWQALVKMRSVERKKALRELVDHRL